MTEVEMLDNMRRSRAGLMKLISKIPEAVATSPRAIGEWSVKDLVSHMSAWEEVALERLELIKSGRESEIRYIDEGEVEERNAKATAAARATSWRSTLEKLAAVRARVMECLEEIDVERLSSADAPVPIHRWLPNFTYVHEREHLAEIRALLKNEL